MHRLQHFSSCSTCLNCKLHNVWVSECAVQLELWNITLCWQKYTYKINIFFKFCRHYQTFFHETCRLNVIINWPTSSTGKQAGTQAKEIPSVWQSFSLVAVWLFFCVSGHPNMGGPMQRMTPPRGMVPLGPQVRDQMIYGDYYKMLVLMVIL